MISRNYGKAIYDFDKNEEEIKRLFDSGYSFAKIHRKLTKEGKINSSYSRMLFIYRGRFGSTKRYREYEDCKEDFLKHFKETRSIKKSYELLLDEGKVTMGFKNFYRILYKKGLTAEFLLSNLD